jgi:hypothetical protein
MSSSDGGVAKVVRCMGTTRPKTYSVVTYRLRNIIIRTGILN